MQMMIMITLALKSGFSLVVLGPVEDEGLVLALLFV